MVWVASWRQRDLTNPAIIDVLNIRMLAVLVASLTGQMPVTPSTTAARAVWENAMYNNIICAIGLGSRERAERLLRTSHALLSPDGELTVAHVIERFLSGRESPDEWAVSTITEAEEKLNALCRRLGITATIDVRMGTASTTLLTIAKEKKADLIILATHTSDIIDRIFGSTVEYVIRHAECSVLVERADKSHDDIVGKADTAKKA
jgi:nucleotide-binding universal stress UspA family protein